jgi:hypothetical protein
MLRSVGVKTVWFLRGFLACSVSLLLAMSFFGTQGCVNKTPGMAAFVATSTPTLPSNVIDDLEDGDVYLNPAMSGVSSGGAALGYWVASTWGDTSNIINGSAGAPFVFRGGVGAAGTLASIHIYGTIKDNADAQYPSFQLQGKLKGGAVFDTTALGYKGVRFYYKVGSGDNCPTRKFFLPVSSTTPPIGGGTCTDSAICYDHFGATLASTADLWVQKIYYFRSADGTPVLTKRNGSTKPNETDLQRVLEVQWQFGRNNLLGTSTVDYWVDEVEFF